MWWWKLREVIYVHRKCVEGWWKLSFSGSGKKFQLVAPRYQEVLEIDFHETFCFKHKTLQPILWKFSFSFLLTNCFNGWKKVEENIELFLLFIFPLSNYLWTFHGSCDSLAKEKLSAWNCECVKFLQSLEIWSVETGIVDRRIWWCWMNCDWSDCLLVCRTKSLTLCLLSYNLFFLLFF